MTSALLPDPTNYGNTPGQGPLRPGGQAPTANALVPRPEDLPSTESKAVKEQADGLALARDLWGGTERVRAKAQAYLPQHPKESPANYRTRLLRSVFFNVYRNTIVGLAGFVFRKDPALGDDVPLVIRGDEAAGIEGHWENIDNCGTHGDVFARDLLVDAMNAGHAGILVDYPQTPTAPGTQLTLGDEQALNIRPYWVHIKKDQVVSFRMAIEHGTEYLAQIVLRECLTQARGHYGEQEITVYRVLWRDPTVTPSVGWRVERVTDRNTVDVLAEGTYPTQIEIPLAEVPTAGRISSWVSQPMFSDLAYLNVAHYQQWSDYATAIHKTNVPILVTSGVEVDSVDVGPNSGINLPPPDAKAYYIAHDGAALGSSKAALDDLKNDMAHLGLAALQSSSRAQQTAKALELQRAGTDAPLAVTARGEQDALERALGFHARYLGLDDGGSVTINREFIDMTMDAADVTALSALATALSLPVPMVLEKLIAGGWFPEDTDVEQVALDIQANQQAIADEKAQQLADAAALANQGQNQGQNPGQGRPPAQAA